MMAPVMPQDITMNSSTIAIPQYGNFLSKNHELIFQAGAGIVSKSNPKNELQEINNKLGALNKALELAEKI